MIVNVRAPVIAAPAAANLSPRHRFGASGVRKGTRHPENDFVLVT